MDKVSERVKKALDFLRRHGYAKSDAAIARKLGVTPSTIAMAKTGERTPTWGMLLDLCDNYPINFWWLRTGEGGMIQQERELALLQRIAELEKRIADLEQLD